MNAFNAGTFRRARHWWQARDARERGMLAVMFAMLAGFALWYGIVTPLLQVRTQAQAHYDRAAAELIATRANTRDIAVLLKQRPVRPTGGAFSNAVLASAKAADVAVSRQRVDGQGALTVGIDAVQATALFDWLDTLRRDHGIAPQTLSIAKANGRLRVEVSFSGTAP